MFTDTFSPAQLAEMLTPYMNRNPWPAADTPDAMQTAQTAAKATGVWEQIGKTIDRVPTFLGMPESILESVRATGVRAPFEKRFQEELVNGTHAAALAVWLEHPQADRARMNHFLAGWETVNNWVHPLHQGNTTLGADLYSSKLGVILSSYRWLLRDQMDEQLYAHLPAVLEKKLLAPAVCPDRRNWWHTAGNNWNHVVLSNLIATALYVYEDPQELAAYIHPLIEELKYGLEGYTPDGACTEGIDYWSYGFKHFLQAALMLDTRTGGQVNLIKGHPHLEAICRYPLACYIDGSTRMCWADSYHGYVSAYDVELINHFFSMPELYCFCERPANGWPKCVMSVETLLAARPLPQATSQRYQDAILPDLGACKAYASETQTPVAFACVAGDNGVNHNHNDIGSFLYYHDGVCFLTDPGYPTYTAEHFSPKRYTKFHCRSLGHSVPFIDGTEQADGKEYCSTLTCHGFNTPGEKQAVIDMTRAYPLDHLERLVRTLTLAPDGTLTLADAYRFTRAPQALEEIFITYETVHVADDGLHVRIGTEENHATLSAEGIAGHFESSVLEAESAEGRGQGTITRIRFVPEALDTEMELTFQIR